MMANVFDSMLLYVLILNIFTVAHFERRRRVRRSLLDFGDVIQCSLGRNGFLAYNGYGCYCGYGGSGSPMDEIDKCCFEHDRCYELSRKQNASCSNRLHLYVARYKWECQQPNEPRRSLLSRALRTLKTKDSFSEIIDTVVDVINTTVFYPTPGPIGIPVCLDEKTSSSCGRAMCRCDSIAAMCFANFPFPKKKPKCSNNATSNG